MQYRIALLSLATSASAIDGYFFNSNSCGGSSVVCSNMNPNSCCNAPSGWNANTVGYYGIPGDWRIQGNGYSSGGCVGLASVASSGGSSNICLGPVGRYLRSSDYYFVSKKLYPNVDFYSGIIFRAIGIPTSMFTVLFAVARTVGWISQWNEMLEDPDSKIGRPRQLYVGQTERPYKPLHMRG